jgi:hypothetical protein
VKNKIFWVITSFALILGTYITVSQTNVSQDTRTKASTASTTLYFKPSSTGSNPIQKQAGDLIPLDIYVDPGDNLISLIRLQIKFNSDKLTLPTTNQITINSQVLPVTTEGPILSKDSLSITLSIGPDGTKAIQSPTKVGTINFKAVKGTNGTTTLVSFSNLTQALSIGPNDKSYESVLSSTTPATIIIGEGPNLTPATSINPTQSPSISPIVSGPRSTITFELLLHGVGSAGDNPNPSAASLSNKSPIFPQRELNVEILDQSNKVVSTSKGAINYDASSGSFKGSIPFDSAIEENHYIIKIKTPRYLKRRIPGIQKITPNRDNRITNIDLVAGDTNNDNALDILDYNAFLDCGYGRINPLPKDDSNSVFNSKNCQNHTYSDLVDLNDDGIINSADYNLFLRELSVKKGD